MPEEAGFQEHFLRGQAGDSGENEGIVLHFRLHLRLTCLAGLIATCSNRKTPVWSQDDPGLKLQVRRFRQVASSQWAPVSPFSGWQHYWHIELLWGLNQLMHEIHGHMAVSPVWDYERALIGAYDV